MEVSNNNNIGSGSTSPRGAFPFYKPDTESNIIFLANANRKDGCIAIKWCTLAKLIEKMTQTLTFDNYSSSAFFLTYREFTTPIEVIQLLQARYSGPPTGPGANKDHLRLFEIEIEIVQSNVVNIAKQFMGTLIQKDFEDEALLSNITEFINSVNDNDSKNELFDIFVTSKRICKQLANNQQSSPPQTHKTNISSAASTMRFSFSVSPKTSSPNSTFNVLNGLLSTNNNVNNQNISNTIGPNSPSHPTSLTTLQPSHSYSENLSRERSSMKIPKGIMSKLLNSGSSNNSGNNITNSTSMSVQNLYSGSNMGLDDDNPFPEKTAFLPEVIARELTVMEFELISSLTISELSQKQWNKENQAVNIQNFITWFNRISSWVTTKIISKETPEERAIIIEAFINIANYARELKNYNCVMEILGSLHNSSISRLKNSWALISTKANDTFQVLNTLMSTDNNFKVYRKHLAMVLPTEPCIPYLGLFLTDYTYLSESNPPTINDGMVNVERIYLISSRVQEFFQLFTNCRYPFGSMLPVREAILAEKVWDENETFKLSKLREETLGTNGNNTNNNSSTNNSGSSNNSGGSSSSSNSTSNSLGSGGSGTSGTSNGNNVNSGNNGLNGTGNSITQGSSSSSSNSNSINSISTSISSGSSLNLASEKRRKNFVTKYRMSFTGNDPQPSIASTLSDRDWNILTTNAKLVKYRKGKRILSIGEINNNLYRVQFGRVKFESPVAIEETRYIESGEIFGEEAFLYERPMSFNVISDSDECELVEIEKTFILQLFGSEPILAATYYKHIAVLMAERLLFVLNHQPDSAYSDSNTNSGSGAGSTNSSPQRSPNGSFSSQAMSTLSISSLSINNTGTVNNNNVNNQNISQISLSNSSNCSGSSSGGSNNSTPTTASPKLSSVNPNHNLGTPTMSHSNNSLNVPSNGFGTPTMSNLSASSSFSSNGSSGGGGNGSADKRRSMAIEPSSLDLLRIGNDSRFCSTFRLSPDEVIIKSYTCKHNGITGTLYITKHHLCFEGKFFGIHKQKTSPFDKISKILPDKGSLSLTSNDKNKKFSFKNQEELSEAYGIMTKIWKNHHIVKSPSRGSLSLTSSNSSVSNSPSNSSPTTPPRSPKVGRGESFSSIPGLPTKDEWNAILKGSKPSVYKRGEVLVTEGVEFQKIFQITRGECTVVKGLVQNNISSIANNTTTTTTTNTSMNGSGGIPIPKINTPLVVLTKLSAGSIFGEMSFLMTGGSSISIIVSSDELEVYTLEGYFLNIILKSKPYLAPKFYKYLACVLDTRVKQFRQSVL